MTPADMERRLSKLETELANVKQQLVVLSTGVALARWLGPFIVSVAAIVIVLVRA